MHSVAQVSRVDASNARQPRACPVCAHPVAGVVLRLGSGARALVFDHTDGREACVVKTPLAPASNRA